MRTHTKKPTPRIGDILVAFNGKQNFSVMDICSGFHQTDMEPEDRPKTSLVTLDCQKQYKGMPFAFASPPAIFQKIINLLLREMKWICATGCIHDIIAFCDTWDQHLQHPRR